MIRLVRDRCLTPLEIRRLDVAHSSPSLAVIIRQRDGQRLARARFRLAISRQGADIVERHHQVAIIPGIFITILRRPAKSFGGQGKSNFAVSESGDKYAKDGS